VRVLQVEARKAAQDRYEEQQKTDAVNQAEAAKKIAAGKHTAILYQMCLSDADFLKCTVTWREIFFLIFIFGGFCRRGSPQ
jgi:hypothetical protein